MKFAISVKTLAFSAALMIAMITTAEAQWQADADDKIQVKAEKAVSRFRDKLPGSEQYFKDAYGYAVLASITEVAVGYGGSYGRGLVIEGDQVIGSTGFWQFTSGIQAGAKFFSMIIFFKDEEALQYFKTRKIQFLGQAGLSLGSWGVNGTSAYNDGVAIFTLTRFGLIGQLSISGAKFSYKELSGE
jgi:lipid-binding SYLF domain-containing protein